jgi:glucose/arabinose dehydrogenase
MVRASIYSFAAAAGLLAVSSSIATTSCGSDASGAGANGQGASGNAGGGSASTGGGNGTGGRGDGGAIDPGNYDCTDPTGAMPVLTLEPVVTSGLNAPLGFFPAPGDPSRFFVVQQSGEIRLVKNGVLVEEPFLDISNLVDFDGFERGLLGLAFHPNYQQNGRFFVFYASNDAGQHRVVEYARDADDPDRANDTPVDTFLDYPDSEFNHNGGALAFSPGDGFLYIGVGDGGSGYDSHQGVNDYSDCGNGQFAQTLLGKILRIDVDTPSGGDPYTPMGAVPGALPEIWSLGLRNPWRFGFDPCTADFYIGDVGQDEREEINFEPAAEGGRNYGWRCREGDGPLNNGNNENCPCGGPFEEPIVSIDQPSATTIIGGYVYRGTAIPALRGRYVFGDLGARRIWDVSQEDGFAFDLDANDHFGTTLPIQIVSFGQDLDGELYVVDIGGGVYRIVAQ